MNIKTAMIDHKDSQIRLGWILFGVAALTAWFYPPAQILFLAVIGVAVKKIYDGLDYERFETAAMLLMFASTGLVLSIICATALGCGTAFLN